MDLFSMEELILLQELVIQKKWKLAPREKEFFETLEQLKINSEPQYHNYINQFQKKCSIVSYQTIKSTINEIMKGDYEFI